MKTKLKKDKKENNPIIGGGLLGDGYKGGTRGKITIKGVFTEFLAWGFPCYRKWCLAFTVYNAPRRKIKFDIFIRKKYSKKSVKIGTGGFKVVDKGQNVVIPVNLKYNFIKHGSWQIICSLKDYKNKLIIPLEVRKMKWPEFTQKEILFIKNNKDIPFNYKTNIQCKGCEYNYVLIDSFVDEHEESLKGAYKFPEDGFFKCKECDQVIYLKDIQGQLRYSFKEWLIEEMRRK